MIVFLFTQKTNNLCIYWLTNGKFTNLRKNNVKRKFCELVAKVWFITWI